MDFFNRIWNPNNKNDSAMAMIIGAALIAMGFLITSLGLSILFCGFGGYIIGGGISGFGRGE